ncbi:hypothetical protein [Streptomyces sp. LS1784]|uniref:hypothetical protein n=1 Tax=Streptomyces sp. LS1784 TaxID=2851533 RepID=UPI001CCE1254|nr:hypothetical protein [Streptomyces sp. LS1784]
MSAEQLGDTAERLLPIAAGLACIVRGEGGPREIAHILGQLDAREREVMIVVLAGLVDPDRQVADVLGYLTWDEHEQPVPAPTLTKSLREIAVMPRLSSPLISWFKDEQRTKARIRYHQLGEFQGDIARDLGVNERTIGRWVNEVAA